MKTVEVDYIPGDRVTIVESKLSGTVDTIEVHYGNNPHSTKLRYSVTFWSEGKRSVEWFEPFELSDPLPLKKVGYKPIDEYHLTSCEDIA